ncbi:MAG: restriction endonuclease [Acidilobaceae archaeon]
MGRLSIELGRSLEDLVEIWLSRRGYAYERNVRVETPLGRFETDFLVYDDKGKFIVEVKNLKDPVDRDAVLKAYNASLAMIAYKAVLISSSGFTDAARSLAKLLERVELVELKDIVAELEAEALNTGLQFLEPQLTLTQVKEWLTRNVIRKKFLILVAEKIVDIEPIYYPVYLMKVRIALDQTKTRFKETFAMASAVSGLPLAVDKAKKTVYESLKELIDMSPELVEVYRVYAGKSVSRSELVQLYGTSLWNKLMRSLSARGLVRQVSSRPLVVEILNVLPKVEDLEEIVKITNEAKRINRPPSNFSVKEQLVSIGSVRSFLNQTLGADIVTYALLYIPLFRAKLEDENKNYRIICITGWLRDPMLYLGCS